MAALTTPGATRRRGCAARRFATQGARDRAARRTSTPSPSTTTAIHGPPVVVAERPVVLEDAMG
eukprot:scaffold18928_cov69-Phaeocystis_antarctica.AAC.4